MVPQQAIDITQTTDHRQDMSRFCWLVILGVIGLFALSELAVRVGLKRISQIEGRIDAEHQAAIKSVRSGGPPPQKVLVVGNSLLLEGVNFPDLRKAMAPEFAISRYVIEQTSYLDWYYGLRRLYAEGVHPDIVVLTMDLPNMLRNTVRGEFFAYHMMQLSDVVNVSRDANLPPTETFSLILGRFSAFYATRLETRKVVLARLIPSVKDLVPYMIPAVESKPPSRNFAVGFVGRRLVQFNDLVRQHGGCLIFVVPATVDPLGPRYIQEAGSGVGVPVIVPVAPALLSAADFREDGYHSTPASADRYTAALAPALRQASAAACR